MAENGSFMFQRRQHKVCHARVLSLFLSSLPSRVHRLRTVVFLYLAIRNNAKRVEAIRRTLQQESLVTPKMHSLLAKLETQALGDGSEDKKYTVAEEGGVHRANVTDSSGRTFTSEWKLRSLGLPSGRGDWLEPTCSCGTPQVRVSSRSEWFNG